jgi:hypothetical protein
MGHTPQTPVVRYLIVGFFFNGNPTAKHEKENGS